MIKVCEKSLIKPGKMLASITSKCHLCIQRLGDTYRHLGDTRVDTSFRYLSKKGDCRYLLLNFLYVEKTKKNTRKREGKEGEMKTRRTIGTSVYSVYYALYTC